MKTFTESTEIFLAGATWLTDEDAPMVAGLQHSAQELDQSFQAALLGQYRQIYMGLAKKRPVQVVEDPLERALREARGEE